MTAAEVFCDLGDQYGDDFKCALTVWFAETEGREHHRAFYPCRWYESISVSANRAYTSRNWSPHEADRRSWFHLHRLPEFLRLLVWEFYVDILETHKGCWPTW